MKHSDYWTGQLHPPAQGGDPHGPGARGPEGPVIVPLPSDFDLDTAFASEAELSPMTAESLEPEPDVESSVAAEPAPASMPGDADTRPSLGPDRPRASPQPTAGEPIATLSAVEPEVGTLSVADLLENNVRMEWHQAIAIVQRLCRLVGGDQAPGAQRCLVEPWNVEITRAGDVRVVSAGSSADPAVKQVGRILSALLQESVAPAELRLLASQATFDVPILSSVEDLSLALRHFERPGESDPIQTVFRRGLEAKLSLPTDQSRDQPSPPTPAGRPDWTPKIFAPIVVARPDGSIDERRIALSAVGISLLAVVLLVPAMQRQITHEPRSSAAHEAAAGGTSAGAGRSQSSAAITPRERVQGAPPPIAAPLARNPESGAGWRSSEHVSPRPVPGNVPGLGRSHLTLQRSAGDRVLSAEPGWRAAPLVASGRSPNTALTADMIVMADPLYQPDPATSTPESLAALRASKRLLLPGLARRDFEKAKAAMAAGDTDRAVAEAKRVSAMLADRDIGEAPADLSAAVQALLARASSMRTGEEQRIYTMSDAGVVPPSALSRQLPTTPPSGVPRQKVGKLEIVVNEAGLVESVRLHTPLNRFHERMIVSAAKAWRYRPALKNGRPVRFNLFVSINLPESSEPD